tara:strand:+ start:2185 stop:2973 length:789 start_codon:yes stop_codon:yes gene_type:complete
MTMTKVTSALQAPFHPDDIEWRVQRESRDKSSVLVLAYVTNRAIQARLDEVFTPFGWQNSFHEGPQGGLICKIGARANFNNEPGEWIWKQDGAENTQVEAVKGGISSAMKRAAVQWGIGRYLYNLTDNWVKLQDSKPSANSQGQQPGYHKGKHWAKPNLPTWATPQATSDPKPRPQPEAAPTTVNISPAQRQTLWTHVKGCFLDDDQRKDVFKEVFTTFGDGTSMPTSEYQAACEWVTCQAASAKKDPLGSKLKTLPGHSGA